MLYICIILYYNVIEREVKKMTKNKTTISARLSDYEMNQIEELKQYYAEYFECEKDRISTTEIITWAIAVLHKEKLQTRQK